MLIVCDMLFRSCALLWSLLVDRYFYGNVRLGIYVSIYGNVCQVLYMYNYTFQNLSVLCIIIVIPILSFFLHVFDFPVGVSSF